MAPARSAAVALTTAALLYPLPADAAAASIQPDAPRQTRKDRITTAAPPRRADGKTRPIILVHGFDREADTNCAAAWRNARIVLKKHAWQARSYTFGYYGRARNCDMHAKGTTDTRIQTVGAALARRIYKHFTSKGVAVDIVAHSMGGLVAKAAIQGTNKYGKTSLKWPSHLYVEDVVTLGTPHRGANFAGGCAITHEQCSDMRPRSSGFLKWVGSRPQSQMGTDYTFVTSTGDDTVPQSSATDGHSGPHWVRYEETRGKEITHSGLRQTGPKPTKLWNATWRNRDGKQHSGKVESPLVHTLAALYRHSGY
jgi:triacylglycerol esterase/lipase EstA (alpha/beta hydrolase family)